jgi:hypothetical protein
MEDFMAENNDGKVAIVFGGAAVGLVLGSLALGIVGAIIGGIAGFYLTGKAVYR